MAGPPRHPRRAWPGAVASGSDAALDVTVVVLATWTIVYHAALLLSLRASAALAVEAVLLVAAVVLRARLGPAGPVGIDAGAGRSNPGARPGAGQATVRVTGRAAVRATVRATVPVTVLAAVVAAAAMALDAPWLLVWPAWLAAACSATWLAVRSAATPDPLHLEEAADGAVRREPQAVETAVAVGIALAAAVYSMWVLRSNPDDLFYVNFSQWVAEHGSFPLRDTLFSAQTLPAVNWPPLASYDGLVGALAHLLHTYAGTVVYIVVPPVASLLAVLATWRLLRAWRVQHISIALAAGLVFLLFDGTSSYASPGNLFASRLWQGKVILLCVLVPTLLVLALDHVERFTDTADDEAPRRTTLWLLLAGVAAVGLSTTAMFLVPLLAVAGMAPLARAAPRAALTGFAAMAGYPLAAGVVTVVLGGRSADDFGLRRLYRFEPAWFGHEIFLTGVVAAVGVLAVLVGPLLLPHPAARLTTGLLVLATGVTFVPGVTDLGYRLVGLGPTLWRVSWGCTVAALVGVGAAAALARLHARRPRVSVVAAVAGVAVLAVGGHPMFAGDTSSSFQPPFHWQRGDATRRVTADVIALTRPGDLVLAPSGLAITLVVTDTDLRSVAPRDYVLDQLRDVPSFHFPERLVLVNFVNDVGDWQLPEVAHALRVLDVDVACVWTHDVRRYHGLRTLGYKPVIRTESYRCLTPGVRPARRG